MADDRAGVYYDRDRNLWVYRASAVGDCLRALVAMARGEEEVRGKEREELLNRSANEGVLHEQAVLDRLAGEGLQIVVQQEIVEIPVMAGVIVRGHTDGLVRAPKGGLEVLGVQLGGGMDLLVEVKSMSTKQFQKWISGGFKNFYRYGFQARSYMESRPGTPMLYAVKRREDGLLHLTLLPADDPRLPTWKEVKSKVVLAESWRRRNRSPLPPCDVNQWGCPFFYLHDEVEVEPLRPGDMSEEEEEILAELLPEFQRLKMIEEQGKEAEKARKKIGQEIINLMGDAKQVAVTVDGVEWVGTKSRGGGSSFDRTSAKAELGEETLARFEKRYQYEYVVVKRKETGSR